MGILNVTPDSFSDGGRFLDHAAAIAHGEELIADGADVIDVGGESTRPGASPVDEETELARVLPVVRALATSGVRLSIDTTKPAVARAAVEAGASLINDVSAQLENLAAEMSVGWLAMHCKGKPRTMQHNPIYRDVVGEVCDFLRAAAERGSEAGVRELWLDPGIGFGKTTAHNLALLAHLDRIVALGYPVCIGVSRKRFIGEVIGRSDRLAPDTLVDISKRREGSLAAATAAMAAGTAMVRVHEVRMTIHAAKVVGSEVALHA